MILNKVFLVNVHKYLCDLWLKYLLNLIIVTPIAILRILKYQMFPRYIYIPFYRRDIDHNILRKHSYFWRYIFKPELLNPSDIIPYNSCKILTPYLTARSVEE